MFWVKNLLTNSGSTNLSELGWEWPNCGIPCLLYLYTRKPKDQSTIFIPKARLVFLLLSFLILGTFTGLKLNLFGKLDWPKQQVPEPHLPLYCKSSQVWNLAQGLECNGNSTNTWLLPPHTTVAFPPKSLCFSMTGYNSHHGSPCSAFLWRSLIPYPLSSFTEEFWKPNRIPLYKRLKGNLSQSPPLTSNNDKITEEQGWAGPNLYS